MKINKKNITIIIISLLTIIFIIFGIDDEIEITMLDDAVKEMEDIELNSGIEKVLVTRVVDGDTFEIETGQKVRMIGIDTPERGKYFFQEATDRLKELIDGKEVILRKDVSETDKYGRLLRHVYLEDRWINKQMIEEGFARIATFPPDVYHVELFTQAQKYARDNGLGLWDK
jgi:micrococcal nuclease